MFLTGVRCEGCHNPAFSVQVAAVDGGGPRSMPAGVVSCMACHGPAYKRIYAAWKDAVDGRTAALERQLTATLPAMGMDPPQEWDDARHNFNLVSKGRGVHNINYSYVLLDQAFAQMNDARRQKGLPALSRAWETMPASSCLSCHLGVESQAGESGGRRFAHAPHVVNAKLSCENCHRAHAERPKIEVVRYGPEGCTSCHHRNLTGTSFGQCARCHADPRRATVPSFRGEFSHEAHLKNVTECAACHDLANGDPRPAPSVCAECHN
jgi:hypothetical protein